MELRPSLAVVCMCTSPRMSLEIDDAGQRVFSGGVNFAQVLAHLGRHPVHAEGGVDLLFGGGGDG